MEAKKTSHVYEAISSVMLELSKEGIGKEGYNPSQKYKFRGIDAVYNALSSLLAANKLVIIPRVLDHKLEERVTSNGGRMAYSFVDVEFDLVSSVDGSTHTCRTRGEGMDTSDKSTNKAMSAAYKYMAFMLFCIPTEGDNDADAHTPQVMARGERPRDEQVQRTVAAAPNTNERDAGAWLKKIGLQAEAFKEFKAAIPPDMLWYNVALDASARGVTNVTELMIYVKEGRAPGFESVVGNDD